MNFNITENIISIHLDKSLYSQDIIYKCFYWYGSNFEVTVNDHSESKYEVTLCSKDSIIDVDAYISKIKRDLLDFKLRDIVTKETQTIRELLVAKAFAHFDSEDLDSLSDISDPMGFDPSIS